MDYINKSIELFPTAASVLLSTQRLLMESTTTSDSDDDSDDCTPYKTTNNTSQACDYVKQFSDACEGGGYFMWTEYIVCEESDPLRYFLITVAVIFLLYLFLAMSTAADDFFCPSISSIVDHLKISQSVAGITFMAFGNGAPDIFSTIASVLNTKRPKAGLAIGELLGGGAFVTTIVFSTVIIVKPFKVARKPTLRDIGFFLIGVAWMAFMMLYSSTLHVWEPLVYLILYFTYVSTVIFGKLYRKIFHKKTHYRKNAQRTSTNHSRISELRAHNHSLSSSSTLGSAQNDNVLALPRLSLSSFYGAHPNEVNTSNTSPENQSIHARRNSVKSHSSFNSPIPVMMEPMPTSPRGSNFRIPNIVISPVDSSSGNVAMFNYQNGAFKYKEKDLGSDSDEDESEMVVVVPPARGHTGRRFTIMSLPEARSRQASIIAAPPIIATTGAVTVKRVIKDFLNVMNPLDEDFSEASKISKFLQIIKIPLMILFRLTTPDSEIWCKPLSAINVLLMPLVIVGAFALSGTTPISGGPGLWAYLLPVSIILVVLLIMFTDYNHEPRYYKHIAAYLGFLMSVSWIYAISSEIVNIISMISVISRLSPEILGLTIMAWSNSIGDLVADVSVAKQGFAQMAASAAIGGPLFNLLVGFGSSFFIAKLMGKDVDMTIDTIKALLLILLAISLLSTQIIFFINKFHAKRVHGYILITVYVVFLCCLILTELKVINI